MTLAANLAEQIEQQMAMLLLTTEDLDRREQEAMRLPGLIRDWHDRNHTEGWAVCSHDVCRATSGI